MSPEQAKGSKLDDANDLFSFGAVLYERPRVAMPFVGDYFCRSYLMRFSTGTFTPLRSIPIYGDVEEIIREKDGDGTRSA